MHHHIFVRTPVVKSSMKFRKSIGIPAVFFIFWISKLLIDLKWTEKFCDGFILMWHNHFNSIYIKYQCLEILSFLKILKFPVEFLSLNSVWTISNVDLHSSKTPSKSCFCYLVKFLTILYLFILFIFKKNWRFLHPNKIYDSESEGHEEEHRQ